MPMLSGAETLQEKRVRLRLHRISSTVQEVRISQEGSERLIRSCSPPFQSIVHQIADVTAIRSRQRSAKGSHEASNKRWHTDLPPRDANPFCL